MLFSKMKICWQQLFFVLNVWRVNDLVFKKAVPPRVVETELFHIDTIEA